MEADMDITWRRALGLAAAVAALVGLGQIAACTTDEGDPGEDGSGGSSASTGGTGAAGTPSTSGDAGSTGTGGSSSPSGTVCSSPIVLESATPGIADFEDYDGGADLSTWSFALGGDSSIGLYAGPFGYGDEPDGFPETFEMATGHDSTYALSISDTLADEYGGGMGLWISDCLDATAFSGISFWVRGNAPTGTAKLSLCMEETTSSTPETADSQIGTCPGTTEECVHPSIEFEVPSDGSWAEIQVPWGNLGRGSAAAQPDGRNIWQIQFDIGLEWVEGDGGEYVPVAAAYELVVDDLTFY
jgi:hypothetical protein